MAKQIFKFIIRWLANGVGLWLAAYFSLLSFQGNSRTLIIAGLILAVLNAVIKPILIIFSLPLIAITLGFFLIVINALILYLLSLFYGNIVLESFWLTMVAGIVVSLVNYILTFIFERLVDNE